MNENETTIVKFTNISNFDFNGELGARYGGLDYFIPKGESLLVPQFLGEHLAKHLAQQIILKGDGDTSTSDLPLWSEEKIKEYTDKMVTFVGKDVKEQQKTEAELLSEQVNKLNSAIVEEDDEEDEDKIEVSVASNGEITYANKQEVISELDRKGIKYDPRQNKAQLEKLLTNI